MGIPSENKNQVTRTRKEDDPADMSSMEPREVSDTPLKLQAPCVSPPA